MANFTFSLDLTGNSLTLYTVTFDLGSNGTRSGGGALTQTIASGGTAIAPLIEVTEGWTFTGWDGPLTNVTSNRTISALYATQTITVTFDLGSNGTRSGGGALTQEIGYGASATAPTVTANDGWTFTGWDKSLANIVADVTIQAQYSQQTHTLTLQATDGSVTQNPNKATYGYGETVELTPVPDAGYTFTGWSGDASGNANPLTVTINADTSITASFAPATYTWTFQPGSHGTLFGGTPNVSQSVTYGQTAPTAPAVTAESGYTFSGWNPSLPASIGVGDQTFTAQYAPSGDLMPPATVSASYDVYPDWVRLEWSAVDGIETYLMGRRLHGTTDTPIVISTVNGKLFYEDTTAVAGVDYDYFVLSRAEDGNQSQWSAAALGRRKQDTPLAAPAIKLVTKGTLADRVRIEWERVGEASLYEVYRSVTQEASLANEIETTSNLYYDDRFTDFSVAAPIGWPFYYALRATNATQLSPYSAFVQGWAGTPIEKWGPSAREIPDNAATAIQVSAGQAHNLALMPDGSVIAWVLGTDVYGIETAVPADTDFVSIGCGYDHALAIRQDGSVVAWGKNSDGQCDVPEGLAPAIQVDGGDDYSVALLENGRVAVWGNVNPYRLQRPAANVTNIVQISAGDGFILARTERGYVRAWGRNDHGQSTVPQGLRNVSQVLASGDRAFALLESGDVVKWGKGVDPVATRALAKANDGPRKASGKPPVKAIFGKFGDVFSLSSAGTVKVEDGDADAPATAKNVASADYGTGSGLTLQRSGVPRGVRVFPGDRALAEGDVLSLQADSLAQGVVTYQWFKVGQAQPVGIGKTLRIPSVSFNSAGTYFAVASNADGDAPAEERPEITIAVVDGDTDDDGLWDKFEQAIIDRVSTDGYSSLSDVSRDDDANGDGISNFMAMCLGLRGDEAIDRSSGVTLPVMHSQDGKPVLRVPTPANRPHHVRYIVETKANLNGGTQWTEAARLEPGSTTWQPKNGATVTEATNATVDAVDVTPELGESPASSVVFARLRVET